MKASLILANLCAFGDAGKLIDQMLPQACSSSTMTNIVVMDTLLIMVMFYGISVLYCFSVIFVLTLRNKIWYTVKRNVYLISKKHTSILYFLGFKSDPHGSQPTRCFSLLVLFNIELDQTTRKGDGLCSSSHPDRYGRPVSYQFGQ